MNPSHRLRPVRRPAPSPRSELLFCAICQVSISSAEVDSGDARRTPKSRTFCGVCATATPEERQRRREELEIEFADDAPVIRPVARAAPPSPAEEPPPLADPSEDAILEARVGELERAAFRMNARVRNLEERLDAALRRFDASGS
jgi:hypothetical protein